MILMIINYKIKKFILKLNINLNFRFQYYAVKHEKYSLQFQ